MKPDNTLFRADKKTKETLLFSHNAKCCLQYVHILVPYYFVYSNVYYLFLYQLMYCVISNFSDWIKKVFETAFLCWHPRYITFFL